MDMGIGMNIRAKSVIIALFIGSIALLGCLIRQNDQFGMSALLNLFSRGSGIACRLEYIKSHTDIMPVAVIGSGPAGLTASIYGARGGFRTYVIEGNKPGGLLTETTDVENWPGEDIILGPELIDKMHKQASKLGVMFVAEVVESVDTDQWPYKLTFESGRTAHALTMIIATGATPKRLGIPGEKEFWGYGVTTCAVCDAPFRKGQDVIVIGGGDSAVEEAIQLAPHVKSVTIMVRKDHMRAAARMQDRLAGYSNISIKYDVDVIEIIGEQESGQFGPIKRVSAVKVHDHKEQREYIMPDIRGVFLAIGHDPNSQLFSGKIACDDHGYIKRQGSSQKTSKEGIFVAGDVADPLYRQAITSAGFGCMAMLEAATFLGDVGFNEEIAEVADTRSYSIDENDEPAVRVIRTDKELQAIIKEAAGRPVIVDFYGQTCPSCLQMLPMYEQVAREFRDKAVLVKVDIDESEKLVRKYGIISVPCLMPIQKSEIQPPLYRTLRRKELINLIKGMM